MTISLTDVYRIATSARLEIDAAQAEEVRTKLDAIFGLIDELAAVDTKGVVPMAHAQDVVLPLRARRGHRDRPPRALPERRAGGGGRAVPGAEGDRVTAVHACRVAAP